MTTTSLTEEDTVWKLPEEDDDILQIKRRRLGFLQRTDAFFHADEDVNAQFSSAISLSDEQNAAYKAIVEWLYQCKKFPNGASLPQPVFALGGYAGTGKTTLLGFLAAEITKKYRVAFCTLTGKAASVLSRSLRACGVRSEEYCGTIHRMMYVPEVDDATGEVKGWKKAPDLDYDLIVVDEGSMLSGAILKDMMEYKIPILVVGDHGQLPPVGEDVGIMSNPDAKLKTVRRQALDNPIIALSAMVRRGMDWKSFVLNSGDPRMQFLPRDEINAVIMEKFNGFVDRPMSQDPLLLCGTNKTRAGLNKVVRYCLKTEERLTANERVICLKNAYLDDLMVANGFRGTVQSFGYSPNPLQIKATIEFPEEGLRLVDGILCKPQFGAEKTIKSFSEVSEFIRHWDEVGMLFDWGYALTVHKAQGSQADDVILVIERFQGSIEDFLRWVYTGVTRSAKNITVVF